MDEHMVLNAGDAVVLDGGFCDWNLNDLTFFTAKHNAYATREAVDVINQARGLFARDVALSANTVPSQATVKRGLKENLYNRLPVGVGPLLYFLYRYFCQLGFLDGREGLIYHLLQGFWYRFLVQSKVVELERAIQGLTGRTEILETLQAVTGLDFSIELSEGAQ
jgi:hypothetical protein